jgi:Protein of unknown function (DUF1569)
MVLLHDPAVGDAIRARVRSLSPSSTARWGKMTGGQMLWHCNQVFSTSLGDIQVVPRRPPFPVSLLKLILFHMTWPHNAPTAPEYQARVPRDFEAEHTRCLALMDRFTARKMEDADWGRAVFAQLTGREWSCLHARHLDHHLKQFGV